MDTTPVSASPNAWLELSVAVDQEAAESVSELLAQYGYQGGVAMEATPRPDARGDEPGMPYPLERDPTYPVTLRTYLPLDAHVEEQRQRIEQALWHLGQMRPIGTLQTQIIAEQDWAHSWKQFYSVQRIGTRTLVVPSWLTHTPAPDEVVLHLDPGMAFGTGLHPTTQLCITLLERYTSAGMRVLDLGTGSAILAIAAAKYGVGAVLALDNDTLAIQAAHANIEHNGVQAQVQAALGSLGAGVGLRHWQGGNVPSDQLVQPHETRMPPPYDLVVANIVADILIVLAPDLADALAPDGVLITSGIIQQRSDEVAIALAAVGLHLREYHSAGEWVALVHGRRAERRGGQAC
ncbi:MAG: 50S ribosomal protein L11 methyltransferase [Chloroflexaceae bacterium]|nr:50S ribosomal protein L11 methyltransferase [Chloroflexaceae bacterium]